MLIVGYIIMFLASFSFSHLLSLPKSSPDWELSQFDVSRYATAYTFGVVFTIISILVSLVCWKRIIKLRLSVIVINILWVISNVLVAVYGNQVDICNIQIKYQLQDVIFKDPFWYGMIVSLIFLMASIIGYKWNLMKEQLYNRGEQ